MTEAFDAVVIGSGFGGAVTACRLAERGQSVLVLERGRRWRREDFPRAVDDAWLYDVDGPDRQNGWIDLRVFRQIAVVQGAGVGGGSLIYANVFVPAQPAAFASGWPPDITHAELERYYRRTGDMLQVSELPDGQLTQRHRLMTEAAAATGAADRVRRLPLAVSFNPDWSYDLPDATDERHSKRFTNPFGREQGTCVHCGSCDLGCPVDARNTLDLNYLAVAERHGAEIRPLHTVTVIEPEENGYWVRFDQITDGKRETGSVFAARVVLAAGSLNSTELLLRCRDQYRTLPALSRRLGHGWSANGDFLTPAFFPDRTVSPTRGPTITTAIDFLDGSDRGHRYFVEDGGFPDAIGNALRAAFDSNVVTRTIFHAYEQSMREILGERDPLRFIMPWFGQGMDAASGVMTMQRRLLDRDGWDLVLEWDSGPSEGVIQALIDRHKILSAATGGTVIKPVAWTLLKYLITPHPLGGCNMGTGPHDGVVDHRGEVFGYPRLYVVDGSIVPRAIGLNPSRTIAALAERCADLIQ